MFQPMVMHRPIVKLLQLRNDIDGQRHGESEILRLSCGRSRKRSQINKCLARQINDKSNCWKGMNLAMSIAHICVLNSFACTGRARLTTEEPSDDPVTCALGINGRSLLK